MATFADFYRQQMAGLNTAQPSSAPAAAPLDWSSFNFKKQAENTAQSPINWAIDILSRPLYGVTNAVQGGINQSVDASRLAGQGDVGGSVANVAGAVFGTPLRFLEGFFSNNKDVKRTFSDVLEQSTDKFGSLDPNYVNTPDNVNPVLKGALGLTLDIAGDPLTWIPGAQIAKVASMATRGVRAGIDLAETAVKGAREATDVKRGITAAEDVTKTVEPDNIGLSIPMPEKTLPVVTPDTPAPTDIFGTPKQAVDLKPWDLTGKKAADFYDSMANDIANPSVQSSYGALEKAVIQQYRDMKQAGVKVEFSKTDPYVGKDMSKQMLDDVLKNRNLKAFADSGATLPKGHPMNKYVEIDGEKLHLNDVFRAVHDYFGHAKSGQRGSTVGFGPQGEWEAWRTHRLSLPKESWQALWTETRGQNAWTNYFGKNGDLAVADRPFAVQKAGVVPEDIYAADLISNEGSTLRDLIQANPQAAAMRQEISDIRASVGTKAAVPQTFNDWLKSNAGKKAPTALNDAPLWLNVPGAKIPSKATFGQLGRMVQGEIVGDKLSPRGQFILSKLRDLHQASETVKDKVFTNAYEAFLAKRAEDSVRLTSVFGDRLLNELSRKSSPSSFSRALNALNVALDPATDLTVFESRNKATLAALKDSMSIPAHIRPTANTWDELARADSLYADLSTVNKTFGKTIDDYAAKHVHRKGALAFTEGDAATRTGMYVNQSNTMTQYTLLKGFKEEIDRRMIASTGREKLYGADRAKARRNVLNQLSDEIAEAAITKGMPLNIGIGKDLVPLSFGEVMRSVYLGFDDESKALLLMYNFGSSVADTPLLQAAHKAIMAGDLQALGPKGVLALRRELMADLLNPKMPGVKGSFGQTLPSNIQKTKAEGYSYLTQKQAKAAAAKLPGGEVKPTKGGGFQVIFSARDMVGDLADAIIKAQPKLVAQAATNAAAWTQRAADEGSKIYNTTMKAVRDIAATGNGEQVVKAVNSIPEQTARLGEEMGSTQLGVDIATAMTNLGVGQAVTDDVAIAVKTAKDLRSPAVSYSKAVNTAAQSRADDVATEIYDAVKGKFDEPQQISDINAATVPPAADANVPIRDLADETTINQGIQQSFLTPLAERFNQYHGVNRIRDIADATTSMTRNYLGLKNAQISALAKKYPAADRTLPEAFDALRRGDSPAHLAEPMAELSRILDDLLPVGDKGALDSAMLRNEGSIANINEALKLAYKSKKGPHDAPQFDFGNAKMSAQEQFGKNATDVQVQEVLANQWKTWSIGDDPLDFLSRMADATATVTERRMFSTSFVNRFTRLGLASTEPKPGMVKIVATGKSTFRSYLPDKFYVDKDLVGELHRLDALVRTSTQLQGELGHAVRKYFLPWQNMWKSNITVMRPGHHIRNAIGDGSITWLQRGNRYFLSSYGDAQRVLGFKNNYTDVNIIEDMRRLAGGEFKLPQGGDIIIRGTGRWAGSDLTTEGIHGLLQEGGLLNNFHRAEDLLTDALEGGGTTRKITDVLSFEGTRIKEIAGGVSEYTAHMGRAQHFIQAMKQELTGKGRFKSVKNMDELIQKVIREVKRTHPDGSMLTTFERKYLRVIIPFYSWFGKTLPLALEASLRQPGRLLVMPKASYNLAVAMGINPDTLSDPFPSDQLFPSFLTDGFFGPQFKIGGNYVNVNPGFAVTDVFSSITPPRNALGMISPLLRVPVELATGSQMATGAKINDTSDYLDQNIPFVNYLANLTGISPTGSVGSILTGKGVDPQLQVARGNKTGFDQGLTLANWLTGMNLQNWSRPNFINYAEIEKRNAAAGGGK